MAKESKRNRKTMNLCVPRDKQDYYSSKMHVPYRDS